MPISAQSIVLAHQRITPYIHRTPVFTSQSINALAKATLFFKCENFQKVGAFKARGGLNAVLSLSEQERQYGIATHSSGNHAAAIAYAANIVGAKAYIVMPNNAPETKKKAVANYGAEIVYCQPTLEARESSVQQIVNQTGATFIHPFNDYQVIAGQATAAKELLEDIQVLDTLITPIGGGGLLSGTALSAYYFAKNISVYAAEPEGAADAILSFQTGKIEKAPFIQTIADGLLTNLGTKTLPIIRSHVQAILLATDQEIIASMQLVWERMKIIIEPSSAVALAVVLKNPNVFANKRIGVVFSGGNVDLAKLPF